jgi:hypothetical protein
MVFIWSDGAVGVAWAVGAVAPGETVCWAIASVAPCIIVSARADKANNFIFMYIPQIIKSIY